MKKKVDVKIFGQSYTIMGDASPEYMEQLANYVNTKMSEISAASSKVSQTKVGILAALNIADEVFQLREQFKKIESTIDEKSGHLIELIDTRLE